jgi:hypothetical protein
MINSWKVTIPPWMAMAALKKAANFQGLRNMTARPCQYVKLEIKAVFFEK